MKKKDPDISLTYLNSASTSWPKAPCVLEAVQSAMHAAPAYWPGILEDAHAASCAFFGITDPSRFMFTGGCTQALSLALGDYPWHEGDVILISSLEHHALSRAVIKAAHERGVMYYQVPYKPGNPFDLEFAEEVLKEGKVRMIATTMASNVTGEMLPYKEIVELAHRYGAHCLLDAAQTAGLLPLDVDELGADIFVFAGHKGPTAPHGVGGFYLAQDVALNSPAAMCEFVPGQTGKRSCSDIPGYCDIGSVNLSAVAGLSAGVKWLKAKGMDQLRAVSVALTQTLIDGLIQLEGVRVLGGLDAGKRTSAVSVVFDDWHVSDIEKRLLDDYGIVARAGFHCAPMAHEVLGTSEGGTLRFSTGPFSTADDINVLLNAMSEILADTRVSK